MMAVIVAAISSVLLGKEKIFPYAIPTDEVQITLKTEPSASSTVYSVKANDIDGEVLLSPASQSVGDSIVNAVLVGVTSTFENRRAPYAGHISEQISCATQKYLKEQKIRFENRDTTLVLAVANDRRIFGSCTTEQIKYAAAVWAAYDEKQQQVVTVRLFKPIDDQHPVERAQDELVQIFGKVIAR